MRSQALLVIAALASCRGGEDATGQTTVQPSVTGGVVTARINQLTEAARVLELLDAQGEVVARYYPSFFNATVIVPDVDTGEPSARSVAGSWLLSTWFDAATGRVSVAVRGFVFAETSFDLVYQIETRGTAFAADPYGNGAFTYVPFDGRKNDGTLPDAASGTRPWLDIVPESLYVDEYGRLTLSIADAAGSTAELTYGTDLTIDTCAWHFAGAPARCPDPSR